jgi:type IV pilus assembly protein PilY1
MLGRQHDLLLDAPSAVRRYGLDGDVRMFKYDVDGDGAIDSGDKMYIIFGFGRGGSVYYALDVTSPSTPKFLWKKNKTNLAKLGQAWSAPVLTRVNVGSTLQTDPQRVVAIFGGGYDDSQENYDYATDSSGNALYMLELETGNLLWSASNAGANFNDTNMNNAIPSEITVLDIDGDRFADRMYAADMGGRVWRFDIWHGQAPNTLVTGGVFATLGAGHLATKTREDNRRFYYAPDVSVVTPRGPAPFMNIAIGSGYRGHPLEAPGAPDAAATEDRFYALRDYQPFLRRTTASFGTGWTPYTDAMLVDVTQLDTDGNFVDVPDGEKGWKLLLNLDGWRGEKVLAESVTAGGVIFFPTFTPQGADPENPCLAKTLNRTYAVFLDNAKPFGLRDGPDPDTNPDVDDPRDRYIDLAQGGIAPGLAVIQTPDNKTLCLEGVEALGRCVNLGDVVRTFWERRQ